jgi:hypothetical protein
MKRGLIGLMLAACLAVLPVASALPALAQNYSFQVTQETVNAYWESDGSLSLDYVFVFANSSGASPIDFVDVGLPNNSYDLGQIKADVDGHALSDFQKSSYVDIGVAVGLGNRAIPGGKTGTLHVSFAGLSNVLYPDDQDSNYASAEFKNAAFDSSLVHGRTDLTIIYHLPPGVNPDEPRYHNATSPLPGQPETALDDQGRVMYTWHTPSASGSEQYTVGASFPARVVPASAIVRTSALDTFFNSIGDTIGGMSGCCLPGGFVLFWVAMAVWGSFTASRRKLQYLPPKISIEGHGIKRGLTAVEAAVLMEQPLDKVLTMILFSAIKKGAASVVSQTPLRLKVSSTPPAAGLYPYEADFLKAFQGGDGGAKKPELQRTMVNLIKSVSEKMKGFSRKETVDYYKTIIEKAWAQVQAAATPEVKGQKFDEVMDWTLLDHDFAGRSREVLGPQPVFLPMWWGRYSPPISTGMPSAGHVLPTSGAGLGGAMPGGALPHLPGADFAASIANGVQNFSSSVVGNLSNFTNSVTNVTNPPPPPSSHSYRGGGGGGCACACACAGCACACAGGGR